MRKITLLQRIARAHRLDRLCIAGRVTARRYAPEGYDVTIYRGPHSEPVDLVVEAEWHNGERPAFDCPADRSGWDIVNAWVLRRSSWRLVRLSADDLRQVEKELSASLKYCY